jgi:catechol 2,3-dioxygenase-like lactoylglutathione lyase family enzyme
MKTIFILYVKDQSKSKIFYEKLLQLKPDLDVPGMTEFKLSENCMLGLMPEDGIAKIISGKLPHPAEGSGIPRCELYFYVDNVQKYYDRALELNASLVSETENRDWGDKTCYFSDHDGHVIAFAEKIKT